MIMLICLAFVFSMLSNCVIAWTMHTLWSWFCVDSLGAGPTLGAWWGIALITSVIIMGSTMSLKRGESVKSDIWAKPLSVVLSCLLTLVIAWVFGSILGWKA